VLNSSSIIQDGQGLLVVSALSFQSDPHLSNLIAQLRCLPERVRRRLVLEVTGTALVRRPEIWEQRLQLLREFGVRIATDDFGVLRALRRTQQLRFDPGGDRYPRAAARLANARGGDLPGLPVQRAIKLISD